MFNCERVGSAWDIIACTDARSDDLGRWVIIDVPGV